MLAKHLLAISLVLKPGYGSGLLPQPVGRRIFRHQGKTEKSYDTA